MNYKTGQDASANKLKRNESGVEIALAKKQATTDYVLRNTFPETNKNTRIFQAKFDDDLVLVEDMQLLATSEIPSFCKYCSKYLPKHVICGR